MLGNQAIVVNDTQTRVDFTMKFFFWKTIYVFSVLLLPVEVEEVTLFEESSGRARF
jgi:hypothetical protein